MKLADFVKPRKPATQFADRPDGQYWIQDGVVFFRHSPIKGADASSFRYFLGGYGIDVKACYSSGKRLRDADLKTFQVLNFTYAKDKQNVWAMGIRIPTAVARSFVVCDDGAHQYDDSDMIVWCGYGKDERGVYYYDYDGKPTLLKKVDPATFVSLGDKTFAKDANHVFLGAAVLPKADPATWEVIAGVYSRDAKRLYWRKVALPGVNPKKFRVLTKGEAKLRAGGDGETWYFDDLQIKRDEYDRLASGKLAWTVLAARVNKRNAAAMSKR
jgi:hypothetical protein